MLADERESATVRAEDGPDHRRSRRTRDLLAAVVAGLAVLAVGFLGVTHAADETPLVPWVAFAGYGFVCATALIAAWLAWQARTSGDGPRARAIAGGAAASDPEEQGRGSLDRFQVDAHGGRRLVHARDVVWIEAAGNYARLHLAGEAFLYRRPLARLESELPAAFIRVHRSAIVNLDAVRRVDALPSGDAELHLSGGHAARLSRRYARAFHERTGR